MIFFISPSSGNRFKDFFENIRSSSKEISNTPPPLEMSETSASGKSLVNSTSRLEALGK